jgi:hypothetical protein
MTRLLWVPLLLAPVIDAPRAHAEKAISASLLPEPLTCARFETRLDAAARLLGAPESAPRVFTLEHDGGSTGMRFAWVGSDGLSGRLTCGRRDAFADFYMTGALSPSAAAISTRATFEALAAASICALTAAAPEACRALATTMTGDALSRYQRFVADGGEHVPGPLDYDLAKGLDAVVFATPTALSWGIGPGFRATLDAAPAALAPKNKDDEE